MTSHPENKRAALVPLADATPEPGCDDCACDQPRSRWTPLCPDGSPQRLVRILGFRLKAEDYLQLRVVLYEEDFGICQVTVERNED